MSHSNLHARTSVGRFGGQVEDTMALHDGLALIGAGNWDHHDTVVDHDTTKREAR